MCVDKDERITDSRIKSGIQTLLGGMVLGAIPVVFTGMLVVWDRTGGLVIELEHATQQLERIERRLDSLEAWRETTNGNRFRWSDGEALRQVITGVAAELRALQGVVSAHNTEAERYKEKIEEMQRKAHKHNWQAAK